MVTELDTVILKVDLPEAGLRAGDLGTVVLVHPSGTGYEVEFMTLDGETVAVVPCPLRRSVPSAAMRSPTSAGRVVKQEGIETTEPWRLAVEFTRITVNPKQMGGVPCIRGLRIPVATVVAMVAEGMNQDMILKAYPDLEQEDIREALLFAAEAVRERELPLVGVA
jgi:uncharacterized protein (DUF433 family)